MQHPKDPVMAVRAWERVVRAHPDARLRFAGAGPLADSLRRAIVASGARGSITYDGFIDDLGAAYAEASLFLLTSHVEGGTTMATLEAMAQGLVPVVTDAGDAWLVPHHGAGVMTHPSARAVGDAIVDLFDEPERIHDLRLGALRFARELYTPTTMVEGTLRAYADVLRHASLGATARLVHA